MTFDPLHKWFGIPPSEQPPNRYRLLGISSFECDKEVIDSAADKQLRFLHDLTNGDYAVDAERLSNQVSAARLCLLDDVRKAEYDRSLRENAKTTPRQSTQVSSANQAIRQQPANDSSTIDTGWYLRHRDQIEHGPYSIEHLIEAAKAGRIAPDTIVCHTVSTDGQWVLANTIPGIGQYCPATLSEPTRDGTQSTNGRGSAAIRPMTITPKRQTRSRGGGFWAIFVQSAIPFCFILISMAFVHRNPAVKDRIRDAVFGERNLDVEQAVDPSRQTAKVRPRPKTSSEIPIAPMEADNEKREQVEDTHSEFANIAENAYFPVESSDSRPTEPSVSTVTKKLLQLKLEVESTKWIAPIHDVSKEDAIAIRHVEKCPIPITLSPKTGFLTKDKTTRITFENMSGLAIDLRLSEDIANHPLAIVGDWVYTIGGDKESTFSMNRMKSRQLFIAKESINVNRALNQVMAERARITNYLNSVQLKPLDTVKVAENRMKQLDARLPSLRSQVASNQNRKSLYLTFAENITTLNDEAMLVIEVVPVKQE